MPARIPVAVLVLLAAGPGAARAEVPPAPPPLVAFGGLDSSQLPGANPADVNVAAGPGTVVETVNSSIAVWSVTGLLLQSTPLDVFFGRSGDDMTDPRVLFDPVTGRFFAAVFDITRRELDVAASAGADPTGAWTLVPLPSQGCPDQPRLGTSDSVVVITDDLFSSCRSRGRFIGGEITVLSKPELLAGSTAPTMSHFGPDSRFAAITPVVAQSPGPREYMVSIAQAGDSIRLIRVEGPSIQSIPVETLRLTRPIPPPPPAPQAGSTVPVDTGDNRVQNAVYRDGSVWVSASQRCPGVDRGCVRVLQLATPTPRVLDDAVVSWPGRWVYFPAVVPDALGNAAVAFAYSSPDDAPSLAYTYVRPDGAVGAPADVVRGTAPNESGRFGDYSGASADPGDPTRLWLAAEDGSAVGGTTLGWGTGVASVRLLPQPPAIRDAPPTHAAATARFPVTVFPEGRDTRVSVQYGRTARYGARTAARRVPGALRLQAVVPTARLRRGVTYHFRVVAVNATGTTVGPGRTIRIPVLRRR